MVTRDFAELFACFNARAVRAVIVGGYPLAFHAKPRYTKDIDVFVDPTPENAARLMSALGDLASATSGCPRPTSRAPARSSSSAFPRTASTC
jgi:hypothetical protein